jgi:anti-sigma B factor antagonist
MQLSATIATLRPRCGMGASLVTARASHPNLSDHLLTVIAEPHEDVLVLQVTGEIDLATADTLRQHLTEHLASPWRGVVLDFTGVTFLAGRGLRVLTEAVELAEERDVTLRLVAGDARPVWRPLTATGLAETIPQAASVGDGIRRCR